MTKLVAELEVKFKHLRAKFLEKDIELLIKISLCYCVAVAAKIIYLLVGSA